MLLLLVGHTRQTLTAGKEIEKRGKQKCQSTILGVCVYTRIRLFIDLNTIDYNHHGFDLRHALADIIIIDTTDVTTPNKKTKNLHKTSLVIFHKCSKIIGCGLERAARSGLLLMLRMQLRA